MSSEAEERRARRGRSGNPKSEPESEAPSVEKPPDGERSKKEAELLPPQDLWDRCVTQGCTRYAAHGWEYCCTSCKKFEGKRHGPQCQANSNKPNWTPTNGVGGPKKDGDGKGGGPKGGGSGGSGGGSWSV